jgi:hypothetical protein
MRHPVLGAGIAAVSIVAAAVLIGTSSRLAHTKPVSYAVTGSAATEGEPVQLALGDASAAGAVQAGGTRLIRLGCPGETTATLVDGGICGYHGDDETSYTAPGGSQLAAATSYLAAHPGRVSLITIDLGAGDLNPCLTGPRAAIEACVRRAIPVAQQNLAGLLAGLRFAGYRGAIVGRLHDDPDAGQPGSLAVAEYDRELGAVYRSFGAQVVAGPAATDGSGRVAGLSAGLAGHC